MESIMSSVVSIVKIFLNFILGVFHLLGITSLDENFSNAIEHLN